MVPPWVPDVLPSDDQDGGFNGTLAPPIPIAPAGRFRPSRYRLGRYAESGSPDDMRRGLGHYVKRGLGGAETAARRFGGTARTAGTLFDALSSAAAGQPAAAGSPLDPSLLAGRSATEIMDAVIEAVRRVDGTQDAEASRVAIRDALSGLLDRFPEADLLSLSEDQRLLVIERYVAVDVYNRFCLDVGKTIQDKAPTRADALARLKEAKDYLMQVISAAFRKTVSAHEALNAGRIIQMVRQALSDAFRVFEDYVR